MPQIQNYFLLYILRLIYFLYLLCLLRLLCFLYFRCLLCLSESSIMVVAPGPRVTRIRRTHWGPHELSS